MGVYPGSGPVVQVAVPMLNCRKYTTGCPDTQPVPMKVHWQLGLCTSAECAVGFAFSNTPLANVLEELERDSQEQGIYVHVTLCSL